MSSGDIVLIPFPFTDLTGIKNRPALILAVFENTVILSFITSQLKWQDEYDILLYPSELNGLKRKSVLRLNKITTLEKSLVLGKIGSLEDNQMELIYKTLLEIFKPH